MDFRKPPGSLVPFGHFRFSAERTFPKKTHGEPGAPHYNVGVHPQESPDSPNSKPTRSPSLSSPSWRSGWWLAIAAPILSFLILECGLRLCGYGHPSGYFRAAAIQGQPCLIGNPGFFLSYFPPGLVPYVAPLKIPAAKEAGAFRIFVLGESAALGIPEPAFGFSRILDRMLRQRYPSLRFEIVNVSATAINSHVLAPIASACARRQPDLFIVYAGNNEVVGPFGPGTVFAPFAGSSAFIRASIALNATRTGQGLKEGIRLVTGAGKPQARWEGMEMFRNRTVPADDPRLDAVYAHFETNLKDILAQARSAGARTILCTVGTNLRDNAPFASEARPGLGEADAHFRWGEDLVRQGRPQAAAEEFQKAEDQDGLRFRADSRINGIIRAMAAASSSAVYLADIDSVFRKASPDGLPGHDLFYEHVHMRFAGNHLLAATLLPRIDSILLSAGRIPAISTETPMPPEACRAALAMTGWNRLNMARKIRGMLDKPPFTAQSNQAQSLAGLDAEIDSLIPYTQADSLQTELDEYLRAQAAYPDDPILHRNLGEFFYTCDHLPNAEAQFQAALHAVPQDTRTRQMLAKTLSEQGRGRESVQEYLSGLEYEPDSHELHNGLANEYVRLGEMSLAVEEYARTLKDNPPLPEVHYNLAKVYSGLGETDKAVKQLHAALSLNPAFSQAAEELERLQGRR